MKSWIITIGHLEKARKLIPDSPDISQVLQRYQEWIDHNELELALDELEDAVESINCPSEFWVAMREAAINMKLNDRANRFSRILANQFPQ